MEQQSARLRNTGFLTFFFSGICAISAGVVVSLLQEEHGFAYGMTGTLLSLMSIGNLIAGFLVGVLPGALGMKRSVLLLTIGYAVGYSLMGLTGAVAALEDGPYFEEMRERVIRTRERTEERLRAMGFAVLESKANFLFVSHPKRTGKALLDGLREQGILVRWFDRPRIGNYLRISVGTDDEMDALCASLKALTEG